MAEWTSYRPVLQFLGQRPSVRRVLAWGAGDSTLQIAEQWPDAEILCIESNASCYEACRERCAHLPQIRLLHLPQGVAFGGSKDYACYPLRQALASGADTALYDFIFVDGRARCDCLTVAYLLVKPDGVVMLHDAERQNYAAGIELFSCVHRAEALGVAMMSKTALDLAGLDEHLAAARALEESIEQRESAHAFPRPAGPQDILLDDAGGELAPEDLFALLTHPAARPAVLTHDRQSLRALISGNWFFKARPEDRGLERTTMRGELSAANRAMTALGIWHPRKTWFLLHDGCDYWLCNATPVLRTIDQAGRWERWRLRWRALALARQVALHGRCIDLQWCNFGTEKGDGRVFYVDDETYTLDWRRLRLRSAPPH